MNRNCFCQRILLCFFLLIFHSCNFYETKLQIDLPAPNPRLVVHSTFTPFTPPIAKSFGISISQNVGVFDTLKIDQVPDAIVKLFINGQFDQDLKYDSSYGYRPNFYYFPKAGVEYSISVEKEGFETVTAKGTIPEKVLIKETNLIPFAALDDLKNPLSQLSVTFEDPTEQHNFYEIMVLQDQDESSKFKLFTNDQVITSESYYPSPVAFDAKQPDRLLFSDKLINGKTYKLEVTYRAPLVISGGKKYINPHLIFLAFRSVSEDYYRYYTSLLKQMNAVRPEILFGAAEPGTVFSNIKNGYGVFAGYSEDNRTIQVDTIRIR